MTYFSGRVELIAKGYQWICKDMVDQEIGCNEVNEVTCVPKSLEVFCSHCGRRYVVHDYYPATEVG